MRANNNHINLSEDRQKDYQRQQERLKAMPHSADKIKQVSADMMIKNFLRDSFKKPSSVHIDSQDHSYSELPPWLLSESTMVPSHYKCLWSLVQATPELADTQKVSQLLLTSGLHVDVLGYIWNLSNKVVPGQLTKQEFYIVLALVALAQTGCTFSNLSVLKLLPAPSIPVLQVSILKNEPCTLIQQPQNSTAQPSRLSYLHHNEKCKNESPASIPSYETDRKNATRKESVDTVLNSKTVRISESLELSKGPSKNSNFPCIGSSPTAEMEDDFTEFQSVPVGNLEACEKGNIPCDSTDDFTEFQSANVQHVDPFQTVVISQKREIPKIPLPKSLTGKLTTLKSNILKISPESERKLKVLSQPESLSSLPESKISTSNKVSTSISVLGSNHGIGSRLANHSLSAKPDRSKHHRHHKIKINALPSSKIDDDIILGVKPTNIENLMPKCCPKKSKNGKTFVLKESKIRNEETASIAEEELNSGENTRQIEIPMLGTFNETVLPTQKLEPFNVDLISVQEDKYSALRGIELELDGCKPQNASEKFIDDFGDFLSADIPPPTLAAPASDPAPHSLLDAKEDTWSDWNFSLEPNTSGISSNKDNDLLEPFTLMSISEPNPSQTLLRDIFNQTEPNNISRTKAVDNFPQTKAERSETEFWDFLLSEAKTSAENTISRQGSLPSLDLKVSPGEETEQEIVWRKCLESCYSLIQEGFEIFHNITIKSVLDEVFAASKTSDYLNGLNIAYHISKRINENCSEFPAPQDELERLWGRLQELCFEYNIKLKEDEDRTSKGKIQCGICLGYTDQDVVIQGSNSFHPSCANLWVNFIEGILPYSS